MRKWALRVKAVEPGFLSPKTCEVADRRGLERS